MHRTYRQKVNRDLESLGNSVSQLHITDIYNFTQQEQNIYFSQVLMEHCPE
jgi:hypothetical protein